MDKAIDKAELDRRVAIVRRFKQLLGQQRERFRGYLSLLENQEAAICSGNGDAMLACAEAERNIVADIFSIQGVIDPLRDMYRTVSGMVPGQASEGEAPELGTSFADLERMKLRVRAQSARNRELLSAQIEKTRAELEALKDNPLVKNLRRRTYGSAVAAPTIDIRG